MTMVATLEPQRFGSVDGSLKNMASSCKHMKTDGPVKLTGLPSSIESQLVLELIRDLRRIWRIAKGNSVKSDDEKCASWRSS